MCYQPVKVVPKRYYTSIEFKGRFIESPLYDGQIYNSNQRYAYYPCGKCYECREQRIEQWQIRWKEHLTTVQEDSSYMLTLTYNDYNLPHLGKKSTLYYRHVQLFLKRLRKRQEKISKQLGIENPKISYHGCGEYGTKYTKRPHYHILITNLIIPPSEFESIWSHGIVHIGDNVTHQTIKYVLKYTLKGALDNEEKQRICDDNGDFLYNVYKTGKNKGRICQKSFCSKGIGKIFLTDEKIKFYEQNPHLGYLWRETKKDGTPYSKVKPLPRYYKELIFNPNIIENGKIKRDDYGRPVKLYNPLSEDFEKTPRFKKMLIAYQNEQKVINNIVQLIQYQGYDQYLENCRIDKIEKRRVYYEKLRKREKLQEDLNRINGAMLV